MKGKGLLKKLAACLLAAVMLVSLAAPVSAASYSRYQQILVNTGQSYHIMNNNISRNKVSKYTINIMPLETGTRYDLVYGSGGNEQVHKNRTTGANISVKKPYYVKASTSSNVGMIACIKVLRGSVRLRITYSNGYKNGSVLTFKRQAASHQTLKGITVKKNRKVLFERRGSNLKSTSLVMASKSGSVTRRTLKVSPSIYEIYTFNSKSINYRYYNNGALKETDNPNYDTMLGTTGHIMVRLSNRLSGWFTTRNGSVTFYYPTDYTKMRVIVK